jgi:hypothetical protein
MKAATCCKKSAGGVLPGILLVLMPKCPVCLALYLSAATGIGIPFATARYLRILLIAGCVGALLLFAWRRWRGWRGNKAGMGKRGEVGVAGIGDRAGAGMDDRTETGGRLWLPRC